MKTKLKLESLQMKSFVTALDANSKKTVEGGSTPACSAIAATVEICPAVSAAVAESVLWLSAALSIVAASKRICPEPPPASKTWAPGGDCNKSQQDPEACMPQPKSNIQHPCSGVNC